MTPAPIFLQKWVLKNGIDYYIHNEVCGINPQRAKQLAKMFEDGYEVAYVARYREDVHGGLNCEKVRQAYESFVMAKKLNKSAVIALSNIAPKTPEIVESIKECKNAADLSQILNKFTAKKSNAEISRDHFYERIGQKILAGENVNLEMVKLTALDPEKFEKNLINRMAVLIDKNEKTVKVISKISKLKKPVEMRVVSEISKNAVKSKRNEKVKELKKHFNVYLSFRKSIGVVTDHQVLALDRAEENDIIEWKIEVDEKSAKKCHPLRKMHDKVHEKHKELTRKAFKRSILKYFVPMIKETTRQRLIEKAQDSSIQWFCKNVSQLFCREPLKSTNVIALDPGFSACKAAFLKPDGSVIAANEFRVEDGRFDSKGEKLLKKWVRVEGAVIFAIGNGTASFETQQAVSHFIKTDGQKNLFYCVVSEDGASQYSITREAAQEFPRLPPTQVSAVSIGRRLIDPMGEFVKIDPRHLGKGMYQHSINSEKLKDALEVVVRETVSLRGVDVNTASEKLLSKICGLDKEKAAEIVKYRQENDGIQSREELKKIPGIDQLTFRQCAGFLTVSKHPNKEYNPLDATIIHPDQYNVAVEVLKKLCLEIKDAGNYHEIERAVGFKKVVFENDEKSVIDLILTKNESIPGPQQKKTFKKLTSLNVGNILEGVVENQTGFGIFVDIGVGKSALAPAESFKKCMEWPEVGTSAKFRVVKIDVDEKRVSICPV